MDTKKTRELMETVKSSGDSLGLGKDPELSRHLLAAAKKRMEKNPGDPQAKKDYETLLKEKDA